jgi:adenine-specific DNA glycosylase
MIKKGFIPPVSPYCLIQETLFPDEWLILVASMMLNRTSRKQVDQVLPDFVNKWPSPESFLSASLLEIAQVIAPLGLQNRRALSLKMMTQKYVNGEWKHARELHGIGEYAARSWEIFCQGELGDHPPEDGSLRRYWAHFKTVGVSET